MAIRMAMISTTTMSSMRVKPSSLPWRRRSMSFCSIGLGLLVMAMDMRARVPASQAPPAITTGEVLQAARPAFSSPLTRMGPVALRPRLPTDLPLQEHLLTRSIGPSWELLELGIRWLREDGGGKAHGHGRGDPAQERPQDRRGALQEVREGRPQRHQDQEGLGREDHRGALDPRRHRGAGALSGRP